MKWYMFMLCSSNVLKQIILEWIGDGTGYSVSWFRCRAHFPGREGEQKRMAHTHLFYSRPPPRYNDVFDASVFLPFINILSYFRTGRHNIPLSSHTKRVCARRRYDELIIKRRCVIALNANWIPMGIAPWFIQIENFVAIKIVTDLKDASCISPDFLAKLYLPSLKTTLKSITFLKWIFLHNF